MKKIFLLVSVFSILFGQNSVLKQFSNQFADIAEKANPAVVTILTEKNIDLTESHRNLPQDSDLFRFFYNMPRQREYKSTALGSGVIVDSRKGYVITNNHVVEDMDEITVRLLDKSEYDATIIGRDPKSDLAVLQIKAKGLNALKFGAPPHGGMAPGIDRIVMLLADKQNIREVTLFPMNQNAEDLLMGAPSEAKDEQLKELGIKILKKEK